MTVHRTPAQREPHAPAWRCLLLPAQALAVAVWLAWSWLVLQLPAAGFRFSVLQLFWLAALPALSGATLRLLACFAAPLTGQRRLVALAAAGLLLPGLGMRLAVQDVGTPFEAMVGLALLCGLGGWLGLGALPGPGLGQRVVIFTRRHNGLMCWLSLGSLGSYIGFSAALPLLLQTQFGAGAGLWLAALGPLLGALSWLAGTWLAGRCGGARTSFWAFLVLGLGVVAALATLPQAGQGGSLAGCEAAFAVLFAAAGLAGGSCFRMIPALLRAERQGAAEPLPSAQAAAARQGAVEAAAVQGFAGAIGAYGGFFIPKALGSALALTGSPHAALWVFLAFYLSCMALAGWQHRRCHAPMPC